MDLKGPLRLMGLAADILRPGGSIINIGSKGIRVNAIICGPFHTESFDKAIPTPDAERSVASRLALRRIGTAGEIVGTALFLASEASSYMTGTLLALDGGST